MASRSPFASQADKFENIHQLGGVRLGTLDSPGISGASGGSQSVRVAHVNTGAGLRFLVALDRGGDIIDASHNQHNLAYLSPVGLVPPNHAYHVEADWLNGWAGGLVTTCGPLNIGWPRALEGVKGSLHGHYSNTPASLDEIVNPSPRSLATGHDEIKLRMTVRDARMFGPILEVKREIVCTLGVPALTIRDEVTNLGNTKVPHHYLYHVNFGYPLLDQGTRFIYRGKAEYWEMPTMPKVMPSNAALNKIKVAPGPLAEHAGGGERGMIVQVEKDRAGQCHVGIINPKLKLGVELEYPSEALPRLANWQHFGPRGAYVTGLEPFYGSLLGVDRDKFPGANSHLEPGQSRSYKLTVRVADGSQALKALAAHDGPVSL